MKSIGKKKPEKPLSDFKKGSIEKEGRAYHD